MIKLEQSLSAWGQPDFRAVLKQELALLPPEALPLQQGLSTGNYVSDTPFSVIVLSVSEQETALRVQAGVFYQGIIGGCSCADDPTPASEINEYCEIQLVIDRSNAQTIVTLQQD
jgi:hypothetical protein